MKETKRKLDWRTLKVEERQEFYFLLYEQMGPSRSLKKLYELVLSVGGHITLKTLHRYSAKYEWQRRILESVARQESSALVEARAQVERMNQKHAERFQDIGALVTAGIAFYQKKIEEAAMAGLGQILEMDLGTLGKLAETYQRGERLARGQATSKSEVIIEVLAPVVKDIMAVFLAVNVITNDPPEIVRKRQAEFVSRGDAILSNYYGQVKQIEGGQNES